jgi:hypothetical protein
LAVQTTLQPWSASIYHSILQQGLQPSLTFSKVPETLFVLKSSETASAASLDPLQANSAAGSFGGKPPGGRFTAVDQLADCTVSFEDARVAVAANMLTLGYVSRADGQLYLNPTDSSRLSQGDILVALTTQDKVANSGVKLPLSARVQAAALKAAMVVQNHPSVNKLRSLTRPAAAAAATLPPATAATAATAAAGSSSTSAGSSKGGTDAQGHTREISHSSLGVIEEAASTELGASSSAAAAAAAGKPASQQVPVKPPVPGTSPAAGPAAGAAGAADVSARDLPLPQTPEQAARPTVQYAGTAPPPAAAAAAGDSSKPSAGGPYANSLAPVAAAGAALAAAAGTAAAIHSAEGKAAVSPDSDAAAAADVPRTSAGPAAAAAAAAANGPIAKSTAAIDADTAAGKDQGVSGSNLQQQPLKQQQKQQSKKKGGLFACCFAPSVAGDDEVLGEGLAGPGAADSMGKKAPALSSTGKASSFKVGKLDIGKVSQRARLACKACTVSTHGRHVHAR